MNEFLLQQDFASLKIIQEREKKILLRHKLQEVQCEEMVTDIASIEHQPPVSISFLCSF